MAGNSNASVQHFIVSVAKIENYRKDETTFLIRLKIGEMTLH
jgi:hypothetical protein